MNKTNNVIVLDADTRFKARMAKVTAAVIALAEGVEDPAARERVQTRARRLAERVREL